MDSLPESAASAPLDPDPEIAALLGFAPVLRKCRRHDGWTPDRQRAFIAALARLGDVERAAQSVGRTGSGAFKVRTSAGGEGFSDAWDGALALFHARNPGLSRRGGRARPPWNSPEADRDESDDDELYAAREARPRPRTAREARAAQARRDAEVGPGERDAVMAEILRKYWRKLKDERRSRLEGRIVEADFYVRQLTFIEIALELGGKAMEVMNALKIGDVPLLRINATPMSTMLEKLRRAFWREQGEADRPPPARLGAHDERVSTGLSTHYNAARDGDYADWLRRKEQERAIEAEAQMAWEERARREAEDGPSTGSGQSGGRL